MVEYPETAPEVEDVEILDNIDEAISENEFENIEFFTDIEETAEGENGSYFEDLVNSNVVDPNETELTTTNIQESPSATESAEVESGGVNNDEVAADFTAWDNYTQSGK